MHGPRQLIHEIHRRSLWQVVGIYLAGSWGALQVVGEITTALGLPEWVRPFAVVLLVIGFPIVLATAFVQEGAPGLPSDEPTREDATPEATPSPTRGPVEDAEPAEAGPAERLLTWPRAILGGVLAFALLGVGTAGYMTMRTLGIGPAGTLVAKGLLEERAPILVADFQSPSGDGDLARAATEAFRIDLAQSAVVSVVEPGQIADALRRMERTADTSLDPELAREVALREGIPAVIAGEIGSVGGGFQLSARIVRTEDQSVLVSHRETASGQGQVIDAIDRLSKKLRERVGESLRSLQREEPLAQVTTGSLDALRLYSQALDALDRDGDADRAIALLEDAVRRDSAFAMAWRKLGVIFGNRFEERSRQIEALTRAFEHRDHLTEVERRHAAAMYFYQVAGQPARAADELESLLELDPDNAVALNNLGVIRGFRREHAAAESLYVAAYRTDSLSSLSYTNAAQEQFAQGKVEEARRTLSLAARRLPGNLRVPQLRGLLAAATGEWEAAQAEFEALRERAAQSPFMHRKMIEHLAALAAVRGRLEEAERLFEQAIRMARDRGVPSSAALLTANMADLDHRVRQDLDRATERLRRAVAELEQMDPLARPYLRLAESLAVFGQVAEARELVRAFEATVPAGIRSWWQHQGLDWVRGEIALAEGRPVEALESFHRADVGFCDICMQEALGRAHEAAGRPDSAIVAYERYLDTPWIWRLERFDFSLRGPILERLARLHEARGNRNEAARYYGELVELWAEADPELRPRVEAAEERLRELREPRSAASPRR